MAVCLDVDVEGKGFDAALIDERRVLMLSGGRRRSAVLNLAEGERPKVVAIIALDAARPPDRVLALVSAD
ncbi:MAG TPA: hypothetical protein VMD79_01915 [Solirubrobacteraceae bacterium]|nr:hypothetical protein [Solirubrobacteraceae bacterium]